MNHEFCIKKIDFIYYMYCIKEKKHETSLKPSHLGVPQ